MRSHGGRVITPEASDTLYSAFDRVARVVPRRTALATPRESLTYEELQAEIHATARCIRDRAVASGDYVLLYAANEPAFVIGLFAIAAAGAVAVPVDLSIGAAELEFLCHTFDIRVGVGGGRAPMRQLDFVHIASASTGEVVNSPPVADCESDAVVLLTSGVSGHARAASHSHVALIAGVRAMAQLRKDYVRSLRNPFSLVRMLILLVRRRHAIAASRRNQVFLPLLPLSSISGLTIVLQAILCGESLSLLGTFHPRAALSLIQASRVTILAGAPVHVQAMLRLRDFDNYDLSSLLVIGLGGNAVSAMLAEQLRDRVGCALAVGYGSTETGGGVSVPAVNQAWRVQRDTVGHAFPHVEVRIVLDSGSAAEPDVVGEIHVRSASMATALYNSDGVKETPAGWFPTGDLGSLDREGNLTVVGRKRYVISRGDKKFSPEETEAAILSHQSVEYAGVCEVAGEVVAAVVCSVEHPRNLESELFALCKRELSPHKVPDRFVMLPELPTTGTGKVARYQLAAVLGGGNVQ